MRRSDRTGPTGCSVALFTLVALMTHGVILDSIAARADQQGPKFIEVGMTANVTTSQALQNANLSEPETSGEIIWTYSEIGASPASAKPRPKPQGVPLNTLDSLGTDFQTLSTEKIMVSKTVVGNPEVGKTAPRHASFETTALHFGDPADLVASEAAIKPRSPSTRGLPPKVTQAPLKKLVILPQQGGGLVVEAQIVDTNN